VGEAGSRGTGDLSRKKSFDKKIFRAVQKFIDLGRRFIFYSAAMNRKQISKITALSVLCCGISPAVLAVPGTVQFKSATFDVTEPATGTANVTVTVSRSGGDEDISATVSVASPNGGTAVPADYSATLPQTLSWVGTDNTDKTFTIAVNADNVVEGQELLKLALAAGAGAPTVGSQSEADVRITDLPATFNFSQKLYTASEPTTGNDVVTNVVTVNRTGSLAGTVSVKAVSSNFTPVSATEGTDYTKLDQTVTFADGESTKTVSLTVKKDSDTTAAEKFNLALNTPSGGLVGTAIATAVFTITEKADVSGPTVKIQTPKSNSTISQNDAGTATVVLESTAVDPVGILKVEARVNGGAPITVPVNGSVPDSFKLSLTGIENGKNTVEVAATDAKGNVGRASVSFTMSLNDTVAAGAYDGLFVSVKEEDDKITDFIGGPGLNHNGLLHLDVTAGQRFTGTVQMAGVKQTIRGIFLSGGAARFGDSSASSSSVELIKKGSVEDFSLGALELTLQPGSKQVVGTVKVKNGATTIANLTAKQYLYSDKTPLPTGFASVPAYITNGGGTYTALLKSKDSSPVAGTPFGDGAATVVVSKKGIAKIVGKLSDGTAISYSNVLSQDRKLPVFVQLYSNKGFVVGEATFDAAVGTNAASDALATLSWFRPVNADRAGFYPTGWVKGIDLDFVASKYAKPAAGVTTNILGLAATEVLEFKSQGQLSTVTFDGKLSALNVLTPEAGASAATVGNTKFKIGFDTATGLLKSTEFLYGSGAVKVGVTGAVLQKSKTANGYFLYTPSKTNPVGSAESGVFELKDKAP
jgi:hypothetical protein